MELSYETVMVLTYALTGLIMIVPLCIFSLLSKNMKMWCIVACNIYLSFLIMDGLWTLNSVACGSDITVLKFKRKIDILRGKYTLADAWCMFSS
jgi:hypothetical protein